MLGAQQRLFGFGRINKATSGYPYRLIQAEADWPFGDICYHCTHVNPVQSVLVTQILSTGCNTGTIRLSVVLGPSLHPSAGFALVWFGEKMDFPSCALIKSPKQTQSTGESSVRKRQKATVRVRVELLLFGSPKDLVNSWLIC